MSTPGLLVGIPADDATNRAHARELQVEFSPWPDAPPGSVRMRCLNCSGALYLDAEMNNIRHEWASDAKEPPVICLTCAIAFGLGKTEIGHSGTSMLQSFTRSLKRLRNDPGFRLYIEQIANETDTAGEEGMPDTRA